MSQLLDKLRGLNSQSRAILVVALAVLLVGVIILVVVIVNRPAPTPPRQIAMFDSGVPGTPEATAALRFASGADIDTVINYSSINAKPEQITAYLDTAQTLGVTVALSLKDLLGGPELASDPALDQDPGNRAAHQRFGATPDDQVRGIIARFDRHPAVWGYFISDELPQDPMGPEGSDKWLGPLRERQQLVKSLSHRPTLTAMYWGGDRQPFLEEVKTGTDELMVDYYPYPEVTTQTMGPLSRIFDIGHALQAVAGNDSWFCFQGFPWSQEPETAKQFGFGDTPPAPDAEAMTDMAKLALLGGVRNLAIFSYGYASGTPGQLDQIKLAVGQIRELPEFTS